MREKFIALIALGIILPFAIPIIPLYFWSLMSPSAIIYDVGIISLAVAFIYYVIKYTRIDRRFIAAPILLLIVSTGVILWSVPLSRTVFSSSDVVPPLYPEYFSGGFSVTETEVGIRDPSLRVAVDLDEAGEYLDRCVQFILLNYTLEQLEQVSNISTLINDEHEVGRFWYLIDPPTMDFPLPNVPCTYVWVLWVNADYIPEIWTLDIDLTLQFSIL